MKTLWPMLAQVDAQELLQQFRGSRLFGMVILFAALFVVILVGAICAILFSKKRKKKPHRHHHHEQPGYKSQSRGTVEESDDEIKVRKKWRRQRRPHRPMNPTLAETRGLPPVRDHNTPPPLP